MGSPEEKYLNLCNKLIEELVKKETRKNSHFDCNFIYLKGFKIDNYINKKEKEK